MSGNASSSEKTEQPTPKKLEQSRKKGMVAKSVDLQGSLVLMAILGVFPAAMAGGGTGVLSNFRYALANPPQNLSIEQLGKYTWNFSQPLVIMFFIISITAMVVGVSVSFAQVGFKPSGEAMQPKMEKLNPLQGLKRLLSKRSLFEAFKSTAKGFLFGYIAYVGIKDQWPQIVMLVGYSPAEASGRISSIIMDIGFKIAGTWLVFGIADYFFQKKSMTKELMMTKDEVKQEMKEQEGSPEVKAARMMRARKLSRSRQMEAVKTADAIITNPTHYSIAIKYDRDKMYAPMVVAKGTDHIAFKIREIAKEHKVPLVPNPPLARALYKQCEIGDFVPRDLFGSVAEVLAFVYRTLKKIK